MGELIWSLIAFVGTHFLLSHPLRAPLVKAVGGNVFQGIYSVVALGPVGDVLWGIASFLMLIGSVLFAGSFFGNPAMAAPGAEKAAAAPARGVFGITRHPMMWGFAIWGIVHALVAPYAASLFLTGAMTFLALGGSLGQDRKKAVLMGNSWQGWVSRTSFLPFGLQFSGNAPWSTAWPGRTPFLLGVVIWLVACYLHPMLGGPIAGIWRWM
jgi:uncharacterized membrane protein